MKKRTEETLKRLVNAISPSGYEGPAANVWKEEAEGFADAVTRDQHGNTVAHVNDSGNGPRVMLAGHCDEIGFMITHIDKSGCCWIAPIGGWDPQIAQGQRVRVLGSKGPVLGVIGKKPIHLMSPEERTRVVPLKNMWIDLGVASKKEAEKLVAVGDPAVIAYEYDRLAGNRAVARGMDDRVGAFAVLEAARRVASAKRKKAARLAAVATVQEEIGLRGATTAAHGLNPDVGIAVDVTFATDHPHIGDAVKSENDVVLGKGVVITRGPNINPVLFDLMVAVADAKEIPYQLNAEPRGTGTDANAIQLSGAGVATGLLGIPNRYMHSPCEVVDLRDVEACIALMAETVLAIQAEHDFTPF